MKVERLVSIIMLLLERKTISAPELAEIFEVSTRTIYRDIDTINQAGIPIVTYPGPNGGIGIMEQYKVDKRLFSTTDVASLLIGLGGIRSVLTTEEIANTLAKVKSMVPQEQLSELDFQMNQITIDLTSWTQDSRQSDYLVLLKKAVAERQTLILDYSNANGDITTREVEPYRLLHKGNSWYLQGYCLLRNELRTFRFNRISKIAPTNTKFTLRPIDFSKLDEGLSDIPSIEATIRFPESAKKDIVGFYGDGVITSFENGFYTAKIQIADNERGYKLLFLLSNTCECIAPEKARNYLIDWTTAFAKLYGVI